MTAALLIGLIASAVALALLGRALARRTTDLVAARAEVANDKQLHEAELARLATQLEAQQYAAHQREELLQAAHEQALAAAEEKLNLARATREQLREDMKAISSDVLGSTTKTLAEQVAAQRKLDEQRAIGELAKRTEEIKRVVEPIGEKLGRVESKVVELDRERKRAEGQLGETVRALREGVSQLASEANNLTSALKRPATRGAWGEIQLRNVIEMAGMIERCDFVTQATIHSDEGRLRPDVLIQLPGGKLVVVDSKVPLDAYLAQIEAKTDEERETQSVRHARQTRDHITKLASKGYQGQFDATPELVVMFLPSEGIYHAALAADPSLLEYGVEQQVLIATPTTLIGLLRAIYYGWKQELIAESAREIADTGRELHRRIAKFAEPLAKVGRQLNSAVGAYNDAVGSFDRRVAPQLRKIEAAGAGSDRQLPVVASIEESARSITAVLSPGEDVVATPALLARSPEPAAALAAAEEVEAFEVEIIDSTGEAEQS